MSLSKKILIWIIFLLVVSCGGDDEMSSVDLDLSVSDQRVEDFMMTETKEGELSWKLIADYADMYEDKDIAQVNGVELTFFENGEPSSTLTSDWGTVDMKTHNMIAYENVVIVTEEGDKLKTSKLRWDNGDRMVRSDEKVKMERGDSIIYGVGFESDPQLNSFKTTKMVGYLTEEEVSEYSGEEE